VPRSAAGRAAADAKRGGWAGPVTAHPDDPVSDELDALLGQPEIRERLEEAQRRFEAGETRTISHEDVRRRLGFDEFASTEPPSPAQAAAAE
jgi:hypothetical protein